MSYLDMLFIQMQKWKQKSSTSDVQVPLTSEYIILSLFLIKFHMNGELGIFRI